MKYTYIDSYSAEDMHEHSKKWFSELSFIKDEQRFLINLIHSFAIKPIDKNEFSKTEDFRNDIEENQKRLNPIIKQVQKHMNQLEIMIDGVNQLEMEQAYRKTHKKLFQKVNQFLLDYRTVKERGFAKLSSILKSTKQKKVLGNPNYQISTIKKEKINS
ncbi:hypothetical protein [Maribacter arcticus]|uniref:Uncharacterized protein n=1 Tax=Maribacter arcticus TaxID=561365 RepID=A0A1T4ZTK8_9FLAO|nr:hypothetical protein [Maribacter arcticus]SKB26006.1 hypothetical protein SAMN05660866_00285 [Maribacter arcticus]